MSFWAIAFSMGFVVAQGSQVAKGPEPALEQHIQSIIKELPADSQLRRELSMGAIGDGARLSWMDDMRKAGVKKAIVQIGIHFDRDGRPKETAVKSIELFEDYGGTVPVSDTARLHKIRSSGLTPVLSDFALKYAAHGAWVDLPRPRLNPFNGGAELVFYDDGWLPSRTKPLYCAGESCGSADEMHQ